MGRKKFVVQIDKDRCIECGKCKKICSKITHPKLCSGCGKCIKVCPVNAITLVERTNNKNNKTYKTMKTRIFGHIVLVLLAVTGFSIVTMLLWNALLPSIFGIVSINFWQALGLLALTRVMFGGMAGMMGHFKHHPHNPIHEKWTKMTPEQRKRFIERRKHFCFGHPFDKSGFDWNEYQEAEKGNDCEC